MMPHPLKGGLTFSPTLEEFAQERANSRVTILSGDNNSGKTLVLKYLKATMGKTAYMVGTNRIYHVYQLTTGRRDPNELDKWNSNFQNQLYSEDQNHDQNHITLDRNLVSLSDSQRKSLLELCSELIGAHFILKRTQSDNELSPRYIDVDDHNLSVASTGTRLLITILGICMDDRFEAVLIDEPELGLSPRVQSALAEFLQDSNERNKYFPHLKQVVLATHSHLFLHRETLGNNYIVRKAGAEITLSQVQDISEFHRLQFNLLGNSLESLFLPSGVVYVEGETDQHYIDRVLSVRLPGRNIVVVRSAGDPKKKLHALRESLGDLQKSPFRDRLFVVVDSTHPEGLKGQLVGMGLPEKNFIAWSQNGIEYLYPPQIMTRIFSCSAAQLTELSINDDIVSLNRINKRKVDLCEQVVREVERTTELPPELENGLLEKVADAIG